MGKIMARSYYQNTISDFLREDVNAVFGQLAKNHQHTHKAHQLAERH